MTDKIVILSTCGSQEEAQRIASALVGERLAACVNVITSVRSLYRWEGKVQDDREALLVIKTTRPLFEAVRRAIERLHSYQVPEVICLPVIDGAPNYLNWVSESVRTVPESAAPGQPVRAGAPRRKQKP